MLFPHIFPAGKPYTFYPECYWGWCGVVQSHCLQAEPAEGVLSRPNSSWDTEKHMACVRQNVVIVPHPSTELCRTAVGNYTWSPSGFWTARNLLFHSLCTRGATVGLWSMVEWKRIPQEKTRSTFLTLVHICISFSLLSKLCLSFVLNASLRIRLFSTENWPEKNPNKMNCAFQGSDWWDLRLVYFKVTSWHSLFF